jgi:NADPH:quinone reductase-like Zn-dependent oxidoreductase
MKAILYTRYGPPEALEHMDVPKPVPGDTQVLVKVLAASANALDWRPLTFPPLVLRLMGGGAPKPMDTSFGADLAGVVAFAAREEEDAVHDSAVKPRGLALPLPPT